MAVARLGAIITDLAGSIGGTTFRRAKGNLAVYNKPNGLSKNKLRANIRLPLLSSANKGWGMVPKFERDAFDQISRNVQFPDKFGNMRYITPRQVFNKSAGRLIVYELDIPAWLSWQYSTPIVEVSAVKFKLSTSEIDLELSGATEEGWLLHYMVYSKRPFNEPIFQGQRLTAITPFDGAQDINMWVSFVKQNPGAEVGDYYRWYIRPLSIYGFPGNWQFFDGIIT